jgi:CHASE3 domain sensor protein
VLFRPRSIVAKGLLLVALPVAFQFITAAVILVVNDGAARAERDAQATTEVLQRTERISEIILNGHSALRGMVLHRDWRFEVNARGQLDTLLRRIGELRPLVTEDVQQHHLEQIRLATERTPSA